MTYTASSHNKMGASRQPPQKSLRHPKCHLLLEQGVTSNKQSLLPVRESWTAPTSVFRKGSGLPSLGELGGLVLTPWTPWCPAGGTSHQYPSASLAHFSRWCLFSWLLSSLIGQCPGCNCRQIFWMSPLAFAKVFLWSTIFTRLSLKEEKWIWGLDE